jgi:hypothetical protein
MVFCCVRGIGMNCDTAFFKDVTGEMISGIPGVQTEAMTFSLQKKQKKSTTQI